MSKVIFKYPLKVTDRQSINIPEGSKIISCQFQFGTLCLWAIVDPEMKPEVRHIEIYGTGNPTELLMDNYKFIATVQAYRGELIYHVFELL